jgi:methylglutaconyl-CoA hydratase
VAAIGSRHARRLFLTAAPFTAGEANTLGLLHLTTSPEQLDQLVTEQIDHLLKGGPAALRAAKQLVRRVAHFHDREVLGDETARLLARLRVSPEGKEGLSAFLERRKSSWTPG